MSNRVNKMNHENNIFEISIYNQEVRDLVKTGESHRQLDDSWSENRYLQIEAENEEKATTGLRRRYPEAKGYVFTSVIKFAD